MTETLLKTPLYDQHVAAGARMVDFGGWLLPTHYTSQMEEHRAVRNHAGMFDVSHMTVSDITGKNTLPFLSKLLANNISKVTKASGKAMYSCMLNETGGVIDDLIVYYLNDEHCRLVTNAGTNKKDMAWLQQQATAFSELTITEKPHLALIAVQGPNAIDLLSKTLTGAITDTIAQLSRFQGMFCDDDSDIFIGRTGYTGEDGVEMIVPATAAPALWQQLENAAIVPCGLGARDTLRLEAGMALYGADLGEDYTPIESGLSWTVSMKDERNFIGRAALEKPAQYKVIGLMLEAKGVLRAHQKIIINEQEVGEITSGIFSPTLGKSIALARVTSEASTEIDAILQVHIRQKYLDVRVVQYPFVKK